MPQNTAPIFTAVPDVQWGTTAITAANTAKDGTGTVLTVFTADTTNGGYVQRIRFKSLGTNIQTVARLFINNGATNATAANNIYHDEITLPATTLSENSVMQDANLFLGFALPAGYKLNIVLGTAVAAGYYVSVIGGKY